MSVMNKTKRHKSFRLKEVTINMIERIVDSENNKLENKILPEVSEREIVERAIEYYHSSMFGEEVLDLRLERLSTILGNRLDLILRPFVETMGSSMNMYNEKLDIQMNLLALLFSFLGFNYDLLDSDNNISERVEKYRKLFDVVAEVVGNSK